MRTRERSSELPMRSLNSREKIADAVLAVLAEVPGREVRVSYIRRMLPPGLGASTRDTNKALAALARRGSVERWPDVPARRVYWRTAREVGRG